MRWRGTVRKDNMSKLDTSKGTQSHPNTLKGLRSASLAGLSNFGNLTTGCDGLNENLQVSEISKAPPSLIASRIDEGFSRTLACDGLSYRAWATCWISSLPNGFGSAIFFSAPQLSQLAKAGSESPSTAHSDSHSYMSGLLQKQLLQSFRM